MTAVKNYLVGAHYRIKSTQWAWKDTKDEGDQYELYKRMYQLSRASVKHFLEGKYTEICQQGDLEYVGQQAKLGWKYLRDLWHSEPCNMFILGPDCSMIRPTKIFGEFNEFRMFNWTDPKNHDGNNPWNYKIENYFNADMMYFPHTMDPKLWDMYDELVKDWEVDNTSKTWGNDQIVANKMFWSQNIPWEQAHRPDLFYQAQWIPWMPIEQMNEWNQYDSKNAHVIHWHGSRSVPLRLSIMTEINRVLGVPEYDGVLK